LYCRRFHIFSPSLLLRFDSGIGVQSASTPADLAAAAEGEHVTTASASTRALVAIDGTNFTSFSKTGQWGQELYADLVAPGLESDLLVETWIRGSKIPSQCPASGYSVKNIVTLQFPQTLFKETQDHSKVRPSMDSSFSTFTLLMLHVINSPASTVGHHHGRFGRECRVHRRHQSNDESECARRRHRVRAERRSVVEFQCARRLGRGVLDDGAPNGRLVKRSLKRMNCFVAYEFKNKCAVYLIFIGAAPFELSNLRRNH